MNRNRLVFLAALAVAVIACAIPVVNGSIDGSKHDFEGVYGLTQICQPCHAPHDATNGTLGPLWDHADSGNAANAFTPYDNTANTQDSTPGDPGATSMLCLSCHDGSVNVDAFGGGAGTTAMAPAYQVGADLDLSDDHPIGIAYADGGPGLNPTTTALGSVTIADALYGGNVECASCHDVHNAENQTSLLRESITGSALCLVCHAKSIILDYLFNYTCFL